VICCTMLIYSTSWRFSFHEHLDRVGGHSRRRRVRVFSNSIKPVASYFSLDWAIFYIYTYIHTAIARPSDDSPNL